MTRHLRRCLALGLVCLGATVQGVAYAGDDVAVSLTAQRVTTSNGKEALVSAEQALPGEVIEYRATYKNQGSAMVKDLFATLPVPAGLSYLPKTAQPTRLLASTDGRTFEAVPLKRRVKQIDGREAVVVVPVAEYRYLRWSIGTLGAKESRTVRARMRVAPLEPVSAVTTVPAR